LANHLLRHHQYSAFEEYYITITQAFYLDEASRQAEALKHDPNAFFSCARGRIQEEAARSREVLPLSTWGTIREVTEHSLWSGRTEWLADASESFSLRSRLLSYLAFICALALAGYMNSNDYDSLRAMYTLFARVEATKALEVAFANHVRVRDSSIT
jgi:cullin-4